MNQKITVTYSASANTGDYHGDRENIHISVEIDSFDDYADTLELLRSKVLEKLDLKAKYDEVMSDYSTACRKLERITKDIAKAHRDWETVKNFMVTQGLKTDTAEFPSEALTNLSKSLPAESSGYPE